jgi:hypothetical protein
MICPTSCFGRIPEDRVNQQNTVVFLHPCYVEVGHRGLYGAVAKTVFYGLDILSIFQKMCCEGMAERVSGKLRVKTGTVYINQKVPHISIEKYTTYQQERIASVHKK